MTTDSPLRDQRVLVLGSSGFLGGRLVERLVAECGAQVRILVRRVATGSAAARFPVEVQMGDLADPEAVRRAVAGCTVVFNCAKGSGGDAGHRRAVDVDASGEVVEAAARAGARVVHVSSFAVYDLPRDGDVDEHTPDAPPGDVYSDNKLAGERLVLATGARLGVPVTVLQPTVVYGPRGTVHAADVLEEMHTGRLVLVDGGTGTCNAVYVDDVVTALLLAATRDSAAGERILVSGPEHPTWADFFGHFERMLGRSSTVAMSEAEALALWEASRRRPWLVTEALRVLRDERDVRRRLLATREGTLARTVAGRVAPRLVGSGRRWVQDAPAPGRLGEDSGERAPIPTRPWVVGYLAKRARVRTGKAESLLGYRPVFGLAEGMRLTEAWARWADLLG
ncbi:NAD-dependent epimerase/dehydratase family protein [Geodermatophilus sp. SYSU D00684]